MHDHIRMQRDNANIVIHNPSKKVECQFSWERNRCKCNSNNIPSTYPAILKETDANTTITTTTSPHLPNYSEVAFNLREVPFSDVFPQSTAGSKTSSLQRPKGANVPRRKKKQFPQTRCYILPETLLRKGLVSQTGSVLPHPIIVPTTVEAGNLEKQIALKGGLSLNELGLDDVSLLVPFYSCTGEPKSCYKWGRKAGGSQTALSMYPCLKCRIKNTIEWVVARRVEVHSPN